MPQPNSTSQGNALGGLWQQVLDMLMQLLEWLLQYLEIGQEEEPEA